MDKSPPETSGTDSSPDDNKNANGPLDSSKSDASPPVTQNGSPGQGNSVPSTGRKSSKGENEGSKGTSKAPISFKTKAVVNNRLGTSRTSNANNTSLHRGHFETKQSTRSFSNPMTASRYLSNKNQNHVLSPNTFRGQVEKAMREHKIFYIVGYYPAVRNALKKRGWVEKNVNLGLRSAGTPSNAFRELDNKTEEKSDIAWANRVLREYPPDFIWVVRRENIEWKTFHKDQIINRFPRASFTTKVGLASLIQNMHWFCEIGVSEILFPRCYRICNEEERLAFVEDYRLTACMGLLKWLVASFERDGEDGVMSPTSRVTSLCVDFAVRQLNNYVRLKKHEDIDWLLPPAFMNQHWEYFLQQYHTVVHQGGKISPNNPADTGKSKYELAKKTLNRASPYWPQYKVDGYSNVWIAKPGARSRGKGIVLMNDLDKILDLTLQSNAREANWVAQKYMERPMLIYKTKFDIRQWFIVTDWSPLTVWSYKESYIRFCSRPFTLDDFHEQVHLCNNAIQCRYQNTSDRDSSLPDENMWDCYTFQAYLKMIGKLELWDSQIYPMMKQAVLGTLFASQENADLRKNCFELYGADFMLDEDLKPWLIEINSCPCMASSTSVTARMCAQCLEDLVKVVVDKKADKNADTGMFELIYKSSPGTTVGYPINSAADLIIHGKRLTREVDWANSNVGNPKSQGQRPGGASSASSTKSTNKGQSLHASILKNANRHLSVNGLHIMNMNPSQDPNWRMSTHPPGSVNGPMSLRDTYSSRLTRGFAIPKSAHNFLQSESQQSQGKKQPILSNHSSFQNYAPILERNSQQPRFYNQRHNSLILRPNSQFSRTLYPIETRGIRQPSLASKALGSVSNTRRNSLK